MLTKDTQIGIAFYFNIFFPYLEGMLVETYSNLEQKTFISSRFPTD